MKQKNIFFYKKLVFINKRFIFVLSITNQKSKNMTTTTNQSSEFLIFFGHDRILDKVHFSNLSQVMSAISDNIFMFTNDNFQFSEKSITVELFQESQNDDYSRQIMFKIPVSKFNLIKKMNLGI